jgi:hypothetical protein
MNGCQASSPGDVESTKECAFGRVFAKRVLRTWRLNLAAFKQP